MDNEARPADAAPPVQGRRPAVLIVDDEVDVTATFTLLFELNGFDVRTAGNGVEALAVLAEGPPDLIVSDCMMPLMDGLELCQRVRADPAMANVPIILMSGAPDRHDLASVRYDAFLKKPFLFSRLMTEVHRVLPGT
jgi:CheY-like chemotaxis protein